MKESRKGFTLIEILMVVAIIGLLASVVLASLGTAKDKGNIAKRLESSKQLENALEVYYINHNNTYPTTGGLLTSACTLYPNVTADWIPGLVASGAISSLPTDPDTDGASNCCYLYRSDGKDYKLFIGYSCGTKISSAVYGSYPRLLDPQRDTTPNDGLQNWNGVTVLTDWAIYTPGGSKW